MVKCGICERRMGLELLKDICRKRERKNIIERPMLCVGGDNTTKAEKFTEQKDFSRSPRKCTWRILTENIVTILKTESYS
jgi:hypothetical protein